MNDEVAGSIPTVIPIEKNGISHVQEPVKLAYLQHR